jgi:hypothetical protein
MTTRVAPRANEALRKHAAFQIRAKLRFDVPWQPAVVVLARVCPSPTAHPGCVRRGRVPARRIGGRGRSDLIGATVAALVRRKAGAHRRPWHAGPFHRTSASAAGCRGRRTIPLVSKISPRPGSIPGDWWRLAETRDRPISVRNRTPTMETRATSPGCRLSLEGVRNLSRRQPQITFLFETVPIVTCRSALEGAQPECRPWESPSPLGERTQAH